MIPEESIGAMKYIGKERQRHRKLKMRKFSQLSHTNYLAMQKSANHYIIISIQKENFQKRMISFLSSNRINCHPFIRNCDNYIFILFPFVMTTLMESCQYLLHENLQWISCCSWEVLAWCNLPNKVILTVLKINSFN